MHHLHFNHLALIVAAVILWLLGASWYSPVLFAKPWIAIIGRKSGEKPKGLAAGMIGSFIGDLLLAFVLAHIIGWSGADTFAWGAFVGFIVWLGFVGRAALPAERLRRPSFYLLRHQCRVLVHRPGRGRRPARCVALTRKTRPHHNPGSKVRFSNLGSRLTG